LIQVKQIQDMIGILRRDARPGDLACILVRR